MDEMLIYFNCCPKILKIKRKKLRPIWKKKFLKRMKNCHSCPGNQGQQVFEVLGGDILHFLDFRHTQPTNYHPSHLKGLLPFWLGTIFILFYSNFYFVFYNFIMILQNKRGFWVNPNLHSGSICINLNQCGF